MSCDAMVVSTSATSELDWCDIRLESISWDEGGRDLVIRMSGPEEPKRRTIRCRWAEALDIRIQHPEGRGGRPLTWDGAIKPLQDGRYSVALDFASTGELRVTCSEIDVVVGE